VQTKIAKSGFGLVVEAGLYGGGSHNAIKRDIKQKIRKTFALRILLPL
jgi:hypothetical protein